MFDLDLSAFLSFRKYLVMQAQKGKTCKYLWRLQSRNFNEYDFYVMKCFLLDVFMEIKCDVLNK